MSMLLPLPRSSYVLIGARMLYARYDQGDHDHPGGREVWPKTRNICIYIYTYIESSNITRCGTAKNYIVSGICK